MGGMGRRGCLSLGSKGASRWLISLLGFLRRSMRCQLLGGLSRTKGCSSRMEIGSCHLLMISPFLNFKWKNVPFGSIYVSVTSIIVALLLDLFCKYFVTSWFIPQVFRVTDSGVGSVCCVSSVMVNCNATCCFTKDNHITALFLWVVKTV
uniref:Uncharacterized protein n=1 Tax=Opuntia streptacantha TaxID=393608 RepID=A0A7C9CYZ7_OPUST